MVEEKMYDGCVRSLYASVLKLGVAKADEWLDIISWNISLCPNKHKRLWLEYLLTKYVHLRNLDIAIPEVEEEFHEYCDDLNDIYEMIENDETTVMLLKVIDSYISGAYLVW